jgi:hypothetical protein
MAGDLFTGLTQPMLRVDEVKQDAGEGASVENRL